jgi:hypothetical protein
MLYAKQKLIPNRLFELFRLESVEENIFSVLNKLL